LFYDKLGEEVADEIVTWFNQMDATYRSDLRELNDLNYQRFDARLEQRLAESVARLDVKIDKVEFRLNARIDGLEATLNARIDNLETKLCARIDGVEVRLTARIDVSAAETRALVERSLKDQTRWLFVAWASLLVPIIGLWFRV